MTTTTPNKTVKSARPTQSFPKFPKRLLDDVAVHYRKRAIEESRGNKTEAARLVGLPSDQTMTNWLERHGVAQES